jgi:transposase
MSRASRLRLPANVRVHLYPDACDMRRSFDGLHALVRERLRLDPLSGDRFLFANRRKNRLKVLYWDGSGLVVLAKRLEDGVFAVPLEGSMRVEMTMDEMEVLLGGIDLQETAPKMADRKKGHEMRPFHQRQNDTATTLTLRNRGARQTP